MTKLILIRHGESVFNLKARYTGQTDVPLTEKGIEQAKITAEYILKNYKIDAVYSSDLARAIDTAMPVAEPLGLKIKTDRRLREMNAGKWQGLPFAVVKEKYKEEYEFYVRNPMIAKTPNGEGMLDVLERAYAAILDIAAENNGKTVLVSFHNGPLKFLQVPMLGVGFDDTKSLPNNSITEVDVEGEDFKVIKLGYDGHLGELSTSFKEKTEN